MYEIDFGIYSHEQHWPLAHRGTGQSLPHGGSRAKPGSIRSQARLHKSGELAETAHPRAIIGNAVIGPFLLGMAKPVQIASMTSSAGDLLTMAVMSAAGFLV